MYYVFATCLLLLSAVSSNVQASVDIIRCKGCLPLLGLKHPQACLVILGYPRLL